MYLPLVTGIGAYILSYAMLFHFKRTVSDIPGESIGPGILIINCYYTYIVGLMLCLFTAYAKKSFKLGLIVFLLPLLIFLAAMNFYQKNSLILYFPAPEEKSLSD